MIVSFLFCASFDPDSGTRYRGMTKDMVVGDSVAPIALRRGRAGGLGEFLRVLRACSISVARSPRRPGVPAPPAAHGAVATKAWRVDVLVYGNVSWTPVLADIDKSAPRRRSRTCRCSRPEAVGSRVLR